MTDRNEDRIREAAGILAVAFSWNKTPQGREYWSKVHENLYDLTKERCSHCGQEIKKEG